MTAVLPLVEDVIRKSRCYGIAYDASIKQCGICEASPSCKLRSEGIIAPYTPLDKDIDVLAKAKGAPATKKRDYSTTNRRAEKRYDPFMPEKFGNDADDMVSLALERGISREKVDKILRIVDGRVRTMMMSKEIRKTYEIQE